MSVHNHKYNCGATDCQMPPRPYVSMTKPTNDPVLEALELATDDFSKGSACFGIIKRAIAIQKAQMTVLKTARKYLEFQRALPGSSTEDYEIWSELDDDFIALDKLKEGK